MAGLTYSVIVATRNRHWDIEELLASLQATGSTAIAELILADDASDRPVAPQAPGGFTVRVLRSDAHVGAAVIRNRAAEMASGDVLAFLDDDARVFPDWFEVATRALGEARAITGRIIPLDDGLVSRSRQWRYETRYRKLASGSEVSFFAGGNSAVYRDAFLEAGGFPDVASAADNRLVLGLLDIGMSVHFRPDLRILHRNSKGIRKAVTEAWLSGETRRVRQIPRSLQDARQSVVHAPWRRDPRSAVFNVALQVVHSVSSTLPRRAG